MPLPATCGFTAPSLPGAGGAPAAIGSWGSSDATGAAFFHLNLPVSAGRGVAPPLALSYSSLAGQSEFGLGWSLSLPWVGRRTSKGIPRYDDTDIIQASSSGVLLPTLSDSGKPVVRTTDSFRDVALGATFSIIEYFSRYRGDGVRWERWRSDSADFWLAHDADGTVHVFGRNERVEETAGTGGLEWLLEESVTPRGEHIRYTYLPENDAGLSADDGLRDHSRRRYLSSVRYGNSKADICPFVLQDETKIDISWYFDLVFDYGQRDMGEEATPAFSPSATWPRRTDPYASFAGGFEVRTLRLCRQVLMFHTFPTVLGDAPVLVQRLLLQFDSDAFSSRLISAQSMAYRADGHIDMMPPVEFRHAAFASPEEATFQPFVAVGDLPAADITTGKLPFSFVDLYGEGLPGLLVRRGQQWWYHAPVRDAEGGDSVAYAAPRLLDRVPASRAGSATTLQWLGDIDGNGRLDWLVARPGMAGYFTLDPGGEWSRYAALKAMPSEFFDPYAQQADLSGDGLADLVLVGTQDVRLYANLRSEGFAPPRDVPHEGDALPGRGGAGSLVVFMDILGSGQAHLVEVRHDRVRVWPSLGYGRFGQGFDFAKLPFAEEEFDPSRLRFGNLDGTGATDLIYLRSDRLQVFRNASGSDLSAPVDVAWPEGVRYDRLCDVNVVDLQGLGCASLVLTVPYPRVRHWRCDFVGGIRPHLIVESDNNMGASSEIAYRSSAREWLDAKAEAGSAAVSRLPYPFPVVSMHRQVDQVADNVLTEGFRYRDGFYDGEEREFRGFGLVVMTSGVVGDGKDETKAAATLTNTWYHTGAGIDPARDGFHTGDTDALEPGPTLQWHHDAASVASPGETWDPATLACAARALVGKVRRVERYGLGTDAADVPIDVMETRYLVREYLPLAETRPYPAMQVLLAETIAYRYEQHLGDPRCEQTIGVAWNEHGASTRSVTVHHARRVSAPPPFPQGMPDREYHVRWWEDAHDDAQDAWYITDTLTEYHNVGDASWWRLHMPYRTVARAAIFPRARLAAKQLTYEGMTAVDSPLTQEGFVLSAQQVQHYQGSVDAVGLAGPLESAEFDPPALAAYDEVLKGDERSAALTEAGYERMTELVMSIKSPWSGLTEGTSEIWSARRGIAAYDTADAFHRIVSYRETDTLGDTTVTYDSTGCFPVAVTLPDGCVTRMAYDYRVLVPCQIVDPNETTREVLLDGFGRPLASSFYGTEYGQPAGFLPLADYTRAVDAPGAAIAEPGTAVQEAASASFLDAFSWMGTADDRLIAALRGEGHDDALVRGRWLRASARRGWRTAATTSATRGAMLALPRQPVHVASIVSDQYTLHAVAPVHPAHVGLENPPVWDVPARQHRITVQSFDGFGRPLQQKQKVPPGEALITKDGALVTDAEGKPTAGPATTRWRVSAPFAFNDRGQVCRTYRPYFADTYLTIRDEAYRDHGYVDRMFYDASGRLTVTLTAAGYMRRNTYYPWHTVAEDENDTADELAEMAGAGIAPDGHWLGRRPERREARLS